MIAIVIIDWIWFDVDALFAYHLPNVFRVACILFMCVSGEKNARFNSVWCRVQYTLFSTYNEMETKSNTYAEQFSNNHKRYWEQKRWNDDSDNKSNEEKNIVDATPITTKIT